MRYCAARPISTGCGAEAHPDDSIGMLIHMATLLLRSQIGFPSSLAPRRSAFKTRRITRSTVTGLLLLITFQGGPASGQELSSDGAESVLGAAELAGDYPTSRMQLPVAPPEQVTRAFDRPDHDWSAGHRGVDFAGHSGAPVLAPAAGEVTFAGKVVDREVLVLQHANGLRSSFEPIESALPPGQHVSAGTVVGHIATEDDGLGHCGLDCLHWGVRLDDLYLDPMQLVQDVPSVLLPGSTT